MSAYLGLPERSAPGRKRVAGLALLLLAPSHRSRASPRLWPVEVYISPNPVHFVKGCQVCFAPAQGGFSNRMLIALVGGFIKKLSLELVGKVLLGHPMVSVGMRIVIALSVTEGFFIPIPIFQMVGDFVHPVALD